MKLQETYEEFADAVVLVCGLTIGDRREGFGTRAGSVTQNTHCAKDRTNLEIAHTVQIKADAC